MHYETPWTNASSLAQMHMIPGSQTFPLHAKLARHLLLFILHSVYVFMLFMFCVSFDSGLGFKSCISSPSKKAYEPSSVGQRFSFNRWLRLPEYDPMRVVWLLYNPNQKHPNHSGVLPFEFDLARLCLLCCEVDSTPAPLCLSRQPHGLEVHSIPLVYSRFHRSAPSFPSSEISTDYTKPNMI